MEIETIVAAFGLIFLMEMGDKTQLAVLTLVTRTRQPVAVFAGASLGLIAVTAVAVLVGTVFIEIVPREWLARVAGLLFIGLGVLVLVAAIRQTDEDDEETGETRFAKLAGTGRPVAVAAGSFGLLFLAEMGDKSQLAVVGLTSQIGNPLSVFVGASAALALITLLAVAAGQMIVRYVPMRLVSIAAGVVLILVGIVTLLDLFD